MLGASSVPKPEYTFMPKTVSPLAECWVIQDASAAAAFATVQVNVQAGVLPGVRQKKAGSFVPHLNRAGDRPVKHLAGAGHRLTPPCIHVSCKKACQVTPTETAQAIQESLKAVRRKRLEAEVRELESQER